MTYQAGKARAMRAKAARCQRCNGRGHYRRAAGPDAGQDLPCPLCHPTVPRLGSTPHRGTVGRQNGEPNA